MGIRDKLTEVLIRDYGGIQRQMARDWGIEEEALNHWIRGRRVPGHTHYTVLAKRLALSVDEIHRLCEEDRKQRKIVDVAVRHAGKTAAPAGRNYQRAKALASL